MFGIKNEKKHLPALSYVRVSWWQYKYKFKSFTWVNLKINCQTNLYVVGTKPHKSQRKNQNVFTFKTLYSLKFKVLKEDVLLSTCNWVSKGTNKKIPVSTLGGRICPQERMHWWYYKT